jgi:hypothetical protein
MRNQKNINLDSSQTNKEKARSLDETKQNTHVATLQAHQANHLAKAVPRWPSQAPWLRSHRH